MICGAFYRSAPLQRVKPRVSQHLKSETRILPPNAVPIRQVGKKVQSWFSKYVHFPHCDILLPVQISFSVVPLSGTVDSRCICWIGCHRGRLQRPLPMHGAYQRECKVTVLNRATHSIYRRRFYQGTKSPGKVLG